MLDAELESIIDIILEMKDERLTSAIHNITGKPTLPKDFNLDDWLAFEQRTGCNGDPDDVVDGDLHFSKTDLY